MESVTVKEISRVMGIDPKFIRKWEGYDYDTDTVALTEDELNGLFVLANKPKVSPASGAAFSRVPTR